MVAISKSPDRKEAEQLIYLPVVHEPLYLHDEQPQAKLIRRITKVLKYVFAMTLGVTIFLAVQLAMEVISENSHLSEVEEVRYRMMFAQFTKKYDRHYKSQEDFDYRYSVFKNNVREFEEEEKRLGGVDLDVTQFADWTDHELRNILHTQKDIPIEGSSRLEQDVLRKGESRPIGFDWRSQGKVTSVKNQAQCGSCWAFATVASVEGAHAIKKNQLVSLSEQEMVDCDHTNNGCHGGYRPYAMNFVKRNGLVLDNLYPYRGIEGQQCQLSNNETRVYIDNYQILSRNEEQIADWVATNGPVTFGMNVTKAMYSYRSGVFDPSEHDCQMNSLGSHALTIVGYGVIGGKNFWVVKNSWGDSWGMSGYFHLARGVNSCGAANIVVAPVIN